MNDISKKPLQTLGYGFIPTQYIPEGCDEYYLRDMQRSNGRHYRRLTAKEIEVLVKNENTSDDWTQILVTDRFNPELVQSCAFHGLVRIGDLDSIYLEFHDLKLPVGLRHSTIVSCDFGSNVAVKNVRYMAHTIVGDETILLNIDEMLTTDHAKFGSGILKDGESEDIRVWLEVCNETGARRVLPFDGMLPADAYLWSKYRHDRPLMERFKAMTDARFDTRRGYYGTVGSHTVIKDCRIVKDVAVGDHAYIKGANKLKNLTINSSSGESAQIGEGVELVNGIVGHGCKIFYGVKAVRFVMGPRSTLKYGARLINSFLGDNSTVSCCELLHNLIFPAHEQHHNNSFLCSALVMGQSNIAAGANCGSNHNSRANDGEVVAGRGFWPGLCSTFKHNCRFASFTLVTKGNYPAELNVPLPFSLVSNNESKGCLDIMPAYWFMHNMYALVRNEWKFHDRDRRVHKLQNIEFDTLAPDTVEELFAALTLLERWTALAWHRKRAKQSPVPSDAALLKTGRKLLMDDPKRVDALDILAEGVERSKRPVRILKAVCAYRLYREMINYYGIKVLAGYIESQGVASLAELKSRLLPERTVRWVNLGGQLAKADDVDRLRAAVVSGSLGTWDDIHGAYDRLWRQYPADKAAHAYASLLAIHGWTPTRLTAARWREAIDAATATQQYIADQTYASRAKDFTDPFKQITFDSPEEMEAVMGRVGDNAFIAQVRRDTERFAERLAGIKAIAATRRAAI